MKKFTLTIVLTLIATSMLLAQTDSTKKEKKGSFWNKVKAGVEKNTGLNVSTETLFVYPEALAWKMELVSAIGDKSTGVVRIRFKAMKLTNDGVVQGPVRVETAVGDNNQTYKQVPVSANEYYTFRPNEWLEAPIGDNGIQGEPSLKTFKSIKFIIGFGSSVFEARDIPITWE